MEEQQTDIREVLDLLGRQSRLIVLTLLLAISIGVVLVLVLPTRFTATALVEVNPRQAGLIEANAVAPASDAWRVDSERAILRSDAVLMQVISALDLANDPEFSASSTEAGTDGRQALAALKRAVRVEREAMTYLLTVSATAGRAALAAELANAIARTYIEMQSQAKVEAVLAASEALSARIETARQAVQETRAEISALVTQSAEARGNADQGGLAALLTAQSLANLDLLGALAASPDLDAETATQLGQLQQSLDMAVEQYQSLLARAAELEIEAEYQLADSRIVSPALEPLEPVSPNVGTIMLVAALTGGVLGVSLAFIAETYVGGFASEGQLAAFTRRPVLAEMAPYRPAATGYDPAAAIVDAPLSGFAESVRRVRVALDRRLRDAPVSEDGTIVMVTSAEAGEGKTTTALALGRTYQMSGRKTLVIDCDLREPSVHRHLGIVPETGLLDYLSDQSGKSGLSAMVVRDTETEMNVIVGARPSDVPTDHLMVGEAFERLLAAARENFEIVILDTPGLLGAVDGLHLAREADAIVCVVRHSATRQSVLKTVMASLEEMARPGVPVATVLNRIEGGSGWFRARRGSSTHGVTART